MELGSRGNDRSVFDFSGGPSNYALFLGAPRYWILTKVDDECASRDKIILVSSPVSIRVGM